MTNTDFPSFDRKVEGGLRINGSNKANDPEIPLLSIVTVVCNGERYLPGTIRSVVEQDYDNMEYIIIDGGSTDNTLGIVRSFEEHIDYWVSEPDRGIYDAMNKGIAMSRGEIIGMINADDWYEENVFRTIVGIFQNQPEIDVVHGDKNIYRGDQFIKRVTPKLGRMNGWKRFIEMPLFHPTMFVRRSVYDRLGAYNGSYRLKADYDFFLRSRAAGCRYHYHPEVVANERKGGLTDREMALRESVRVRRENGQWLPLSVLFVVFNRLFPNRWKSRMSSILRF